MDFHKSVTELYLVGPTYAKRLKKLGIETVGDLLYHFPFRYLDYSLISPISHVQPGEVVSVRGVVTAIKNLYTSRGKKIQMATVKDDSGTINIIWFNQPFLVRIIKPGLNVSLAGKVDLWGKNPSLISPEYEIIRGNEAVHTAKLVPIYHETYGISSKWLRSRISSLLKNSNLNIEEFLPSKILKDAKLPELRYAIEQIHYPASFENAAISRYRLSFEELFLIQLAAFQRKKEWSKNFLTYILSVDQDKILEFIGSLPFELTTAQKRAIKQILDDLAKNKPMNRLLEGDVGSGKTVVAAAAIFVAFLNGKQAALMAPTQILAEQHYKTLKSLLGNLGVKIVLLSSPKKTKEKDFSLIIGTHNLIYKRAIFKNLALIIIDEQHRFGVEQRGKLIEKGKCPHLLTMTATPIPRTIALTLYGDLDLSILDEMPPGRQKIKTWVVPPQKRPDAYRWIKSQVKEKGDRAFIVCPFIEESTSETLKSVRAATNEYEKLKNNVFNDLKLGLLHGKLKPPQKSEIMDSFKKGKIDILVSTPVVEVGIDIPSATIMMIEGADRFGLSELHQLRGRVGRSDRLSYCLLFSDNQDEKSLRRLKTLEKTSVGMELAQTDLEMRGPGELYGTRQHGFFDLKVSSFSDFPLIEKTKKAAENISKKLNQYPLLRKRLEKYKIVGIKPN